MRAVVVLLLMAVAAPAAADGEICTTTCETVPDDKCVCKDGKRGPRGWRGKTGPAGPQGEPGKDGKDGVYRVEVNETRLGMACLTGMFVPVADYAYSTSPFTLRVDAGDSMLELAAAPLRYGAVMLHANTMRYGDDSNWGFGPGVFLHAIGLRGDVDLGYTVAMTAEATYRKPIGWALLEVSFGPALGWEWIGDDDGVAIGVVGSAGVSVGW